MRTSVASFSSLTYAICIGVNDPGDRNLPRLATAERDATELATALLNPSGCAVPSAQVQCLTGKNATRESILISLRAAIKEAGEQHAIIIYFAGHALQRDGEFFFCPAGLDWGRPADTAIRGFEVD